MRDLLDWLRENFPDSKITPYDNGRYVMMNSPMRYDRTPSLMVWLDKGNWEDKGGSHESGFLDELCERTGKELPKFDGTPAKKRTDAEKTEADARKTKRAAQEWNYASPASLEHAYLKAKGTTDAFDVRVNRKGQLVVPGVDLRTDKFRMIQTVDDHLNAESKWHKEDLGPATFSGWYVGGERGEETSSLVLVEGPATALSVKTLFPSMIVVCTFGSEQIERDYAILRKRFPSREIVIASDSGTEDLAAKCAGALAVIPSTARSNVDWNDVVLELGQEEAKRQFGQKLESARTEAPKKPKKKNSLGLRFYDELTFTEPEFLIDDLIEKHTTGLMYGATASKKSFLALDMALCVAAGLSFHGRPVQRGAAVYLAGEGEAGILKRVRAWEQHTGVSLKGTPFVTSDKAPRFGDAQGAREAIDDIREKLAEQNLDSVALIVVDTLARAAVGLDENSNQDMSEFVGVLDSIKNEFDCVVLTVHHSGHMEAGRARGASCVPAAMDFIYEVKADRPYVTLTATKMKDAEEPAPITFEQIEMVVMEAKDTKRGKPVTSLALEEVEDSPREKTKPLTKVQQFGLNTFREAARKTGTLDVQLEVWREFFYRAYTGDNPDTKRRAFNRAQKELVELGKLAVKGDIYSEAGEIADLIRNETAKRDTGQSGTLAGHVPLGTLNERDRPGHTPIGVSRCPACVPVENDTREEKEECPAAVLPDKEPEKEEPIFPPRGKSGASSKKKERTPAENLALKTFMIAAEKAGTLDKDGAFVELHRDAWRPFFHEKHTGANIDAKNKAFDKAREQLADCGELSAKNDYYRLSGALADLEKRIVEKLRESGSHESQEEVTSDAHVDVVPSGEVEKEPVILFPRGSLEEHASRSGVPVDQIRESLKPLLESGRIVPSGNDIYENPARPNVEDPSEAIEDDGQEEDAPPPGPEKGEEGPMDSSPRAALDNGGVSVPDVSCTQEETNNATSEESHPTPCIEPEKNAGAPDDSLPRGEGTPETPQQRTEGKDPDKGPGDSSSRGEDPGPVEEDRFTLFLNE